MLKGKEIVMPVQGKILGFVTHPRPDDRVFDHINYIEIEMAISNELFGTKVKISFIRAEGEDINLKNLMEDFRKKELFVTGKIVYPLKKQRNISEKTYKHIQQLLAVESVDWDKINERTRSVVKEYTERVEFRHINIGVTSEIELARPLCGMTHQNVLLVGVLPEKKPQLYYRILSTDGLDPVIYQLKK